MTYAEKLKDLRWLARRREIFRRDEKTCRLCDSRHGEMEVHHIAYRKGREPWEYPDELLVTLCRGCHTHVGRDKQANRALRGLNLTTPLHALADRLDRLEWGGCGLERQDDDGGLGDESAGGSEAGSPGSG